MKNQAKSCEVCCTRLTAVGVKYGAQEILRDINLHIHCGTLTAIIGPNGAGKSTLLKAILEEIPYSGSLQSDLHHAKRHSSICIGYVPQRLDFERSSPVSVLDLFAGSLSKRPLWLGYSTSIRSLAIQALKLTEAEHLLHKRIGILSGGELQRVLLALSLTPMPDLLLLDEPVSGIDPAGVDLFYRMVSDLRQKHHMAVLMVSHDCAVAASYADHMVFLRGTIVTQGDPQTVLKSAEVIQTFGNLVVAR